MNKLLFGILLVLTGMLLHQTLGDVDGAFKLFALILGGIGLAIGVWGFQSKQG